MRQDGLIDAVPYTGRTRVSFLIGSPIAQVLAPGRMTSLMRRAGRDAILVPLEVRPEQLAATFETLKAAPNVAAILVTLPHKTPVARLCDRLSPAAAFLDAVNAARRSADGTWEGDNFDGAGMVAAIARKRRIAGARVHVIGAGAAATSIAAAMLQAGAARLSFNDPQPAAEARLAAILHKGFGPRAVAAPVDAARAADIVINASHCGLHDGDSLPVAAEHLNGGQLVADVITDPLDTPLLLNARAKGCVTVTGGDMLDGQLRLLADFADGAAPMRG
ncbi:shikimate dehydrogenase [Paracoccus litorisediminis]|uniref:shikimate dehydrogenase family protein n=1 Tax=Paracoccus litorisediminis TaxID=2006130 RepID=UPI003733D37C